MKTRYIVAIVFVTQLYIYLWELIVLDNLNLVNFIVYKLISIKLIFLNVC